MDLKRWIISKLVIWLKIAYVYRFDKFDLRFVHFAERDSEIQSKDPISPSLLRTFSNFKTINMYII